MFGKQKHRMTKQTTVGQGLFSDNLGCSSCLHGCNYPSRGEAEVRERSPVEVTGASPGDELAPAKHETPSIPRIARLHAAAYRTVPAVPRAQAIPAGHGYESRSVCETTGFRGGRGESDDVTTTKRQLAAATPVGGPELEEALEKRSLRHVS